ncbi:MAG: NAD(P)H-hydrate dehydratase [Caulobacteraceae bacterium]|nr:NAD(P)H-hydrate dehydratase [Caulobacteraceae bacterium]
MTVVRELTLGALRETPLPAIEHGGDKNSHGRVLVVGGPPTVPGAAMMAGLAALRAGAGKLQFAVPETYAAALALAVPEALVAPVGVDGSGAVSAQAVPALRSYLEGADAVVVGPGTLDPVGAGALAAALLGLAPKAAFVVDAAALSGLRGIPDAARLLGGRAVLTPHHGEMAAMAGVEIAAVEADPLRVARTAARRLNAVVALKSAVTHVAAPDDRVWRNSAGASGLGVCGSGDVLAGIVGGLMARGATPFDAAAWAVFLHAEAGRRLASDIGPVGFLAREILGEIPRVLAGSAAP